MQKCISCRLIVHESTVPCYTTPITAPEMAPLERDDTLYLSMNKLMLRNTALGNFLDWCGVALPSGADPDGLPTGVLMSMPGGRETDLLAAARSVEAALSQSLRI